jgi:hypothetical protein
MAKQQSQMIFYLIGGAIVVYVLMSNTLNLGGLTQAVVSNTGSVCMKSDATNPGTITSWTTATYLTYDIDYNGPMNALGRDSVEDDTVACGTKYLGVPGITDIIGITENGYTGNVFIYKYNSETIRVCRSKTAGGSKTVIFDVTVAAPGADTTSCSVCTESWTCSSWSACTSGSQTRTCTDSNSCGTTTSKPTTTQTCTISACTTSNTFGNVITSPFACKASRSDLGNVIVNWVGG